MVTALFCFVYWYRIELSATDHEILLFGGLEAARIICKRVRLPLDLFWEEFGYQFLIIWLQFLDTGHVI